MYSKELRESVCEAISIATPCFSTGIKRLLIILLALLVKVALPKFQLIGRGEYTINSHSTSFQVVKPPLLTNTSLVTVLCLAATRSSVTKASLTKTVCFKAVVFSAISVGTA